MVQGMPRSAVACIACRERKSKCDGKPNEPDSQCSLCARLDIQCSFILNDARKWPSSKKFVRQLQDRIESLEAKLKTQEQRTSSQAVRCEDAWQTQPTWTEHRTSHRPSVSSIPYDQNSPERVTVESARGDSSVLNAERADTAVDALLTFTGATLDPPSQPTTNSLSNESPDSSAFGRDEVIKKFSGWKGHLRMDPDGRTQYYGVTSDHHTSFAAEPRPDSLQTSVTSASCVLSAYSGLQDMLLDLFWKNQHPFLRVPDSSGFMMGLRQGRKTHEFSPFLLNCIVLRSLHLTDNRLAKKLEAGLFERVKEHLAVEMENPDHNTVLGLLFLSTYASSQMTSGLGWLYSGMAVRILFSLGLHQDLTPLYEAGSISRKQLESRSMILWSAFVNDSMWSVSLGRPNALRYSDIACPPISPLHESKDMTQLAAWAELCRIQANVTELHNGPRARLREVVAWDRLAGLDEALSDWREELPDHLRITNPHGSETPAQIFPMQLAYFAILIVLHRPFAGFENLQRAQSSDCQRANASQNLHTALTSRGKCRTAALEIGALLKAYTMRVPPSQMPTICTRMSFVASTTLIFGMMMAGSNAGQTMVEDQNCLKACIETIGLIESRFPSAKSTKTVLMKILLTNSISVDELTMDPTSGAGFNNNFMDDSWKELVDIPDLSLPSDLNWLLPSTFDTFHQVDTARSPADHGSAVNAAGLVDSFQLSGQNDGSGRFLDMAGTI